MHTLIGVIRHGETLWNRVGRWQGHAPVPLNEEGHAQATILAEHLAPLAGEIAAIYSSDLLRSMQTAAPIAERLGIPLFPEPRLREIDLGEWQGLTSNEIRAWDADRFAAVQADPLHTPRPGGESLSDVAARGAAALEDIARKHAGGHVLVVTHGGMIRTLLHRLQLANESQVIVGNTSLTRLRYDLKTNAWHLDAFNQMAHLEGRETVTGGHEG